MQKFRLGLDKSDFNDNTACPNLVKPVPGLRSFRVQTQEELDKVIKSCASKTCSLVHNPTALLKNSSVLPTVLTTIIDLVNASLATGIFQNRLKSIPVIQRLKKTGHDKTLLVTKDTSKIPRLSARSLNVLLHSFSIIISPRMVCRITCSRHISQVPVLRQPSCELRQT